jgi:hypothetical protein
MNNNIKEYAEMNAKRIRYLKAVSHADKLEIESLEAEMGPVWAAEMLIRHALDWQHLHPTAQHEERFDDLEELLGIEVLTEAIDRIRSSEYTGCKQ